MADLNDTHPEKKNRSPFTVAGVVAFYWTVSITMVFANKYLVGDAISAGDISLFVAWAQCVATVAVVIAISLFRRHCLCQDVRLPPLKQSIVLNPNILILCCTFTGMLTFNNLCLKEVGVAFFQVARSMTLIFTVILTAIVLRKFVSGRVLLSCMLVVVGFILGVDQEKLLGTLSVVGVFYGVVTSLFVALNGIFTKKALDVVNCSSYNVVFYMNIGASVIFIPLVLFTGQIHTALDMNSGNPVFFGILLASGVLSFLIGFASNMEINYTSPVTHHISNNAKSVMQTVLAVFVYHEHKSALWWTSNMIIVFAAFVYTKVKMDEEKMRKAAEMQPIPVDSENKA